jgi:glycerophosphoryl diester phosphodiesterase
MAMEHGMDYSELDVHLGQRGELIVTHDAPIDAAAERQLPRLTDVFDLVRGRMGIYVELKGDATGAALADLVHRGAAREVPLIVGSFRHELVTEVRKSAPEIPRSILFGGGWDVPAMMQACRNLDAAYAHPCFRPIDGDIVDGLHAAGLIAMTPHTNDAAEARQFVNIHVDVIASDDPYVLLPLRAC